MQGKLITLYGINNIGKSTHAKILVEKLNEAGRKAVYVKYPVYDIEPSGPFINAVLRGGEQSISEEELQMWFVLNRYQYEGALKQLLEEGYVVVAEDYVGTGIAWGVAKGLEMGWLENLNESLLKEDLAILFEGERKVAAREKGHVHEENDDLVERCAAVHRELAEKYGWKRLQVQKKLKDTENLLWELVEGKM